MAFGAEVSVNCPNWMLNGKLTNIEGVCFGNWVSLTYANKQKTFGVRGYVANFLRARLKEESSSASIAEFR